MRRAAAPLLLLPLLLGACSGPDEPSGGAAPLRVMLIGLEGADLDYVESRVARGELPAFRRFLAEGAHGKLRETLPLLSPVVWTTLITGREPSDHGVQDFSVTDPATGRLLPISSLLRRTEAVWDILAKAGRKVGVVAWPGTWPAEPTGGFVVSDRLDRLGAATGSEEIVWPAGMAGAVAEHVASARAGVGRELARFVPAPPPEGCDDLLRALRRLLVRDAAARSVALSAWRSGAPSFLAWHSELPGASSQLFGFYAPPVRPNVDPDVATRLGGAEAEAYRFADRLLADALAAADERTVVLVVSDSGTKTGARRPLLPAEPNDPAAIRWKRRFGLVLAWGAGVRPGRFAGAGAEDIVPTVLGLSGVPASEEMGGRFLSEAFELEPREERVASHETDRVTRIRRAIQEGATAREAGTGDRVAWDHPACALLLQTPLNRGLYFARIGEHREAMRCFSRAVRLHPDSERVRFTLASLLERRRSYAQAETEFRIAILLDPRLAAPHIRLAVVLEKTGRLPEALDHARRAVSCQPFLPEARLQLGILLLTTGEAEAGERELELAVALEPDFLEARNRLGLHLLAGHRFEAAAEHFGAAVELDPGYLRAWNNLGVALLRGAASIREDPRRREEILDRALAAFDGTIQRFPDYAKPYLNRAQLRLLRGQRDLARVDAERALELDPDYVEADRLLRLLSRSATPEEGRDRAPGTSR